MVSLAWPGLREEDEFGAASAGHWAALGCNRERGREVGWAARLWLGRTRKRKKKKEGGLGWL
jgi:hypothetical protein